MAEEVNVEADGTTTFQNTEEQQPPPVQDESFAEDAGPGGGGAEDFADAGAGEEDFAGEGFAEEVVKEKGIDPAIYLLIVVVICLVGYVYYQRKKKEEEEDDFFSNLDGEKFNLKLPAEVDEYYEIRAKCEASGWKPGQGKAQDPAQQGPQRVMAQALMKRAIADIPIVTHIQKESAGMNKLYAQSMCSVKQWRSYQNAEAMVSQEVEEVRAEADEIEPGWSQAIWRQAMQYHQMLKQKHEQESKTQDEQAQKRKEIESKVNAEKKKIEDAKQKELAAERAAQELLKDEERKKDSKSAFSGKGGGMKKGFLDKKESKGKK